MSTGSKGVAGRKREAVRSRKAVALEFTPAVTRRHGEVFEKVFLAIVRETEAMGDALALTGVMEWPEAEDDETPAKMRYARIEEEIVRRTLEQIEGLLGAAFVRTANKVIDREREKDRKP